jgi:hypothetical protein
LWRLAIWVFLSSLATLEVLAMFRVPLGLPPSRRGKVIRLGHVRGGGKGMDAAAATHQPD